MYSVHISEVTFLFHLTILNCCNHLIRDHSSKSGKWHRICSGSNAWSDILIEKIINEWVMSASFRRILVRRLSGRKNINNWNSQVTSDRIGHQLAGTILVPRQMQRGRIIAISQNVVLLTIGTTLHCLKRAGLGWQWLQYINIRWGWHSPTFKPTKSDERHQDNKEYCGAERSYCHGWSVCHRNIWEKDVRL